MLVVRERDLNPRPRDYEPRELPDCSTSHSKIVYISYPRKHIPWITNTFQIKRLYVFKEMESLKHPEKIYSFQLINRLKNQTRESQELGQLTDRLQSYS